MIISKITTSPFAGASGLSSARVLPAENFRRCAVFLPFWVPWTVNTGVLSSPESNEYGFCARRLRTTLPLPGETRTSCPMLRNDHNAIATNPETFIAHPLLPGLVALVVAALSARLSHQRSEEHTSELQSRQYL